MKIREMLRKLRLRTVQGERRVDNVDGMAADMNAGHVSGHVPHGANMPPGYVPSQQDDRPRH